MKCPALHGYIQVNIIGKIISVTISRTAHRWFISITVETEDTEAVDISTHPVIGIDVGINILATLSDGTKYDNPRPLKRYERKLKREQRKLSRKVFKSNNWFKQKHKVQRIHYRIACIRNDAHHKATTDIVDRVSAIGIETLKGTNMLKNRKLAKRYRIVHSVGFSINSRQKQMPVGYLSKKHRTSLQVAKPVQVVDTRKKN